MICNILSCSPCQCGNFIRADTSSQAAEVQLKSRVGHSMLLDCQKQELYIFAGQRNVDYLK